MAPELIFPEEELAVTTPRQLAPTVGPMMKGVEIVGAARRAMEKLSIGRVYTDDHGETEIDDSGWTPEMQEVDEGYQPVTAPVWCTKIWAKFSLFALHCIMAYLFKLLKLNKATLGKQ